MRARDAALRVSNSFSINSRMADEVHTLGDLYDSRVYVYRLPTSQPRASANSAR